MAAMKADQCILGMKTYESVIFLHCEHDTHTWGCLWSQLNDLYGHDSVKKPSKLHADTDFNRTALEFFTSANYSLLCELPLMKSMFEHTDKCNVQGPYLHIGNIYEEPINLDECIKLMENLKQKYKGIINICHNLSQQKASEISFNLCDTDRFKLSNSDAYTNLVAYALKGPSLPIMTLCAMLEDLRNALHRNGLHVLVECFDGQWANLCFKDCSGWPLTLFE